MDTSRPRRVVVTGRSIVSPLALAPDAHWAQVVSGVSAVATQPLFEAMGLRTRRAARVETAALQSSLARLPRKQQKLYNRATLLGMLASVNAMDEAGLTAGGGDPERFGVFLGVNVLAWDLTGMTEYLIAAEAPGDAGTLEMRRANQYCMHQINPLDFSLKTLPNLAAGHIAIGQNAQGMCRALTEGAVGGAHAIGQAYRAIVDGDIDLALAGGADYQLEELIFAVHGGLGLFADDDAGGPGPAAGEGAALLVLEDAARAHGRSATVHAEVLGFAAVGGDGVFAPDAEPDPLARRLAGAITAVVEEAGAMPDVVFAHGDGLPAHETAEERALARALGEPVARIPVVRARDRYGDVGAASAAVELAAASVLLDGAAPPPAGTAGPVRRVLVISLGQFGECVVVMVGAPKERL